MLRSLQRFAIGLPVILTQVLVSGCGGGDGVPIGTCRGNCPAVPHTAYLPIEATPASDPYDGPTDLYVIPSNAPATTPIHVAKFGWILSLATVRRNDGLPVKKFFTTFSEQGGDHLWSLDLTDKSTLAPVQVSNLTFPIVSLPMPVHPYPDSIETCTVRVILGNLNDPDSAVLFMSLPNTNTVCGGDTRQIAVVHAGDGAGTAPTAVTLGSDQIVPLYQTSGALAGIVAVDTARNLNFYPDATFTHPTQLLSNVTTLHAWQEDPTLPRLEFSAAPNYAYLVVKSTASPGAGGVYRIDSTGTLSGDLYEFQSTYDNAGLPVVKDDTYYFADSGSPDGRVPPRVAVISHGLAAQGLYVLDNRSAYGPFIDGLSGQQLILASYPPPPSATLLQALPISGANAPTTIASYASGYPDVSVSGNDLLITLSDYSSTTTTESTQILDNSGAVLRAPLAGSMFLSSAPVVLQSSTLATGRDIERVDLRQPTANGVPLKTDAGAVFTLPATTIPILNPITATLGTGTVAAGTGDPLTFVYNLSTGIVTPVSIPNFTVSMY